MKKIFVTLLVLGLLLVFAGASLCEANPFGPPNAIVITIQSDGTVNPEDSPIKAVGGSKYILTENLTENDVSQFERYVYLIIVEKDNVILDGANYTVKGYGRVGVEIGYCNNITLQNIAMSNYELSVEVWDSSNIKITDCSFSNGKRVIIVSNSSQVVIAQNVFAENYEQPTIWLKYSNFITVYGNTFTCRPLEGWLTSALDIQFSQNNIIAANTFNKYYNAITLLNSSNNYFHQNNFNDNQNQVQDLLTTESYQRLNEDTKKMIARNQSRLSLYLLMDYSVNVWDNNYWSNYTGSVGNDGVGTTAYVIDERNADYSPALLPVTLDKATPLSEMVSRNNFGDSEGFDVYKYLSAILAGTATIMAIAAITSILYKRRLNKTTNQ